MPRRVDLPGADELFRPTARPTSADADVASPTPVTSAAATDETSVPLAPSGRVKHNEKFTVYVSRDELLALERLRFDLRAEHDLAVDRGRIVRAAIVEALADVAAHGADSALVRRLTQG